MLPPISHGLISSALDWAYSQATSVLPGLGGAEDLAARSLRDHGSSEAAIDALIRRQTAFAGATGLVTNLGGIVALPLSIPANLGSVLLIQLRMVAAIAHLRGYQVSDERVRTAAYLCLAGSAGGSALQEAGVVLGTRISTRLLGQVSGAVLLRIKQAVGLRIVAQAGSSGLVNVAKVVPVLGGLVGGGIDALVTRGIGALAKQYFPAIASPDETGPVIDGESVVS